MSPQGELNTDVVRRWARAGDDHDLDVFDELFTADTVDHVSGNIGVRWWKEIYRRILDTFPDAAWADVVTVAEDDLVAFRGALVGTHRGSALPMLVGVEPTGRAVRWQHQHLFRLRDGLITEHWATRDDLGLLRGIAPAVYTR